MKTVFKNIIILVFIFSMLNAQEKNSEKLCNAEIVKNVINISIIEKQCLKTANLYESKKKFEEASWYYLLSKQFKKNINNIKDKIKIYGAYSIIAHSYILTNDYGNANKYYIDYLVHANNIALANKIIQDDYKLLLKLNPNKKDSLKKGLTIWNKIYNHFEKYSKLYNLFKRAKRDKKYNEAIKYLKKAIALQLKYKELNSNIYENYYYLGVLYKVNKNYKKALIHLKKAISGYNNQQKKLAIIYRQVANVYESLQQYSKATTYHKKSLKIVEKILGKDNIDIAITYSKISLLYQNSGDNKQAIIYYKKFLVTAEKQLGKNNTDIATSYQHLGGLYYDIGNYKQALMYYAKTLIIRERVLGYKHKDTADSYNILGLLYEEMGNYKQALLYLKKSLEIRGEVLGKNHLDTAQSYNNISMVYRVMGDYENALSYLKKSLVIGKKTLDKNDTHIATIYNNIGLLYQKIGDYKKAVKYSVKSLAIREKILGKNDESTANSYNSIGSLYYESGDYKKALNYLLKSLSISEKTLGKNDTNNAIIYNNIGLIYQKIGNYKKALKYYKKSLVIKGKILGDMHSDTGSIYGNIGLLYKDIKDYKKAYKYTKKSYNIFTINKDKNFQILNNQQKELYLKANSYSVPWLLSTAYLYGEKEHNKKSFLTKTTLNDWLNYKGSIFDSENAIAMLYKSTKDKKIKDKIKDLILAKRDLAKLYQSLPKTQKERGTYQARIKEANKKISELEQEIASKAVAFKEALGLRKVSYKDIAKNLKDNELYIDYAKAGKNYYIFTLDNKENITFNQIDKNLTKEIDINVKAFRGDIDIIVSSPNLTKEELKKLQKHSKKILGKLYNLALNKPLKDILPKYSNLIISPDGTLRLIPFEAMYDAKNNKYIIEEKNIKYTPSGKELIRLLKFAKASNAKNQAVIIANPDFNKNIKAPKKEEVALTPNTNRSGVIKSLFKMYFKPLPGTKEEAKEIEQTIKGKIEVKEFTKENATEQNLYKVKSPKFLHIATHGFFIKDANIPNPMLKSGIALTGANAGAIKGEGTGIVTALKLSGLNLKGTNLVVLSACETGVVDINSTESVSGLVKAFIQAGAKDIVMSLWSVNDKTTKDLMAQFYKNIKQNNSYSQALKSAKLKMIKQNIHPYYWSAFIMSGL